MNGQAKSAVYDRALHLEAYRFTGVAQPFPYHFHTYYVLGLIEGGNRRLFCRRREYSLTPGSMVLFAPGEAHACVQRGGTLDYRALNISQEAMAAHTAAATGAQVLPRFSTPVIQDAKAAGHMRALHRAILHTSRGAEKAEHLRQLLALLLERYGQAAPPTAQRREIARACRYLEQHYARRITLEQLCRHTGLSRSTLLRLFPAETGMTPYRYLETLRIDAAGQLLCRGLSPAEAALQTGFFDQSHFTNYFSRFIGFPPGFYRSVFAAPKDTEVTIHEI